MALDSLDISPDQLPEKEHSIVGMSANSRREFFETISGIENIHPPGADTVQLHGEEAQEKRTANEEELDQLRDKYVSNQLHDYLVNELRTSGSDTYGKSITREQVQDVIDRMMEWPTSMGFEPYEDRNQAAEIFDRVWNELDSTISSSEKYNQAA